MSFPKPNIPEFLVDVLSTKKKHKIRPYTVAEQEALLYALEANIDNSENSNAKEEVINACEKILNSCVKDIEAEKLPSFDFSYLFLKLSAISSGDIKKIKIPCKKEGCDNFQEVEINLNDIKIKQNPNNKLKIDLDSHIGCELRYPTFKESLQSSKELLLSCIKTIYDDENVYPCDKNNRKELEEWLQELEYKHSEKLKEFFDTLPKVYLELKWTCNKCGEVITTTFDAFDDFFI